MTRMLLPGFVEREHAGFVLVARAELVDALEAAGALAIADVNAWRGEVVARFAGRGVPLALRVSNRTLVVKELRHGGLLAPITRGWFLASARLRDTLALTVHLAACGIGVAEILFLREQRVLGPLRRLVMGTALVPGSKDLLARLRAGRAREWMRPLGQLIAGMHDAGVLHADLNLKNVLVADRLYLIDLEASACHAGVPAGLRVKNLERLLRSAAKHALLPRSLTRTDVVRFLKGYDAGSWKNWFRRVHRAHRRGQPWHRLFWRIDRCRRQQA